MSNDSWTILGLSIDMVGALLLSVEAVTLRNIRRMRDMLVHWIEHRRIVLVVIGLGAWFLLHYSLPFAIIGAVDPDAIREIDDGLADHYLFFWFPEPGWLMVVVIVSWVVLTPFWVVVTWMMAMFILGGFVGLLEFIESKTPDGTTGVIGAVLIIVGFTLQIVGT